MAFTKVVGPGIHTLAQLRTHNIHSAGIVTATRFVGEIGAGTGNTSTFTNVNITGNLTVQGDTTTLNTTLRNVELLRVAANTNTTAGIITQTGTGDILNLFDATTEVMTVVDGGKVGIGITNPGVALEIKGTAATLLRLDSSNAQGTSFRIRNSGTDKMYMGLAADFITGQSGNVTDSAIRASGALLFASGGGGEALRIDSSGHLIIGSTSYGAAGSFSIASHGSFRQVLASGANQDTLISAISGQSNGFQINTDGSNNITYTFHQGSTPAFKIKSGGSVRVGNNSSFSAHSAADDLVIGTTSGSNGMTFLTGNATASIFFNNGSANNGVIQYVHSTDPDAMIINSAGQIEFDTGGAERLNITSTGWQKGHTAYQSVGINTFASWARTGGAIRGEVGYNAVTLDYMYFGTGTLHPLALRMNNTTALFIDTNKRLLVGNAATIAYKSNLNSSADTAGQIAQFVGKNDDASHCVGIFAYSGTSNPTARGAKLQLHRARSTDGTTNTAVAVNDLIGSIEFKGNDATSFTASARIDSYVGSGTVGTDRIPGNLRFYTSADDTAVPQERLRILSDGRTSVNIDDARFGQGNSASSNYFYQNDPKFGVQGSIVIGNLSSTATDKRELAFYRRAGSTAGSAISNHHIGRVAWYGSSNDTSFPDMAWSLECTANGGGWTAGSNRHGYLSFVSGRNGEYMRLTSSGYLSVGFAGAPDTRVHIKGNSDNGETDCQVTIEDTDTTAGSKIPSIQFKGNGVNTGRIRGTDGNGFQFHTWNGSAQIERAIIGNVAEAGAFQVNADDRGWATIRHNNNTGMRTHVRMHYSPGNAVQTRDLFRMRRANWGWGHYKIRCKEIYYSGSYETTYFINGHGVNGDYYHVHKETYGSDASSNDWAACTITEHSSSSSPGSTSVYYTDVRVNIPNYRYAIIWIEAWGSSYSTDPSSLTTNSYCLL